MSESLTPLLLPPRPRTLYTTGYRGQRAFKREGKIRTFDLMVKRAGLLVCDIRLNPYSLAPCWRKAEMIQRLGDLKALPEGRYLHIRELGNVNYRKDAPIKIADLTAGIETVLEACRRTGLSPLLLCGCEDHTGCHRTTVGMAFATHLKRWCEITDWVDPTDVKRGTTEDVFGEELTSLWAAGGDSIICVNDDWVATCDKDLFGTVQPWDELPEVAL